MNLASQSTNQDLQRFLAEITAGQVYTFGEPWTREGHLAFIVPIIRIGPHTRKYVLAEEVKDQISVQDLGAIDRLRIQNDSEASVFVRSGLLFRGIGTQSRGSSAGVVLAAHGVREIPRYESQCGILVYDEEGVAGVEVFDSPDSWTVLSRSVLERYGEVLARKARSPIKVSVDNQAALEAARSYFARLASASTR